MKLDDFEKKIFISGLGIIVLILIFYYIHQKSKLREGSDFVITIPLVGAIPIPFTDPEFWVSTARSIITQVKTSAQIAGAQATTVAKAAQAESANALRQAQKIAMDRAANLARTTQTSVSHAKTGIRQKMINYANRVSERANKLREKIMDRKKKLYAEFKAKFKEVTTFRRLLKYGFALSVIFSKIGRWAMKTVTIILLRISNFKSCFIWYLLEIIGWILYLPMEFLVWFFCLKYLEDNFFGMVKDIDCFFNSVMGFHIFYYSENIRQKCFVPQLPPFPYSTAGGMFSKTGMMKLMKEVFEPPNPAEMANYVNEGLKQYKKELLETFKKPDGVDISEIWAEAMSLSKLMVPGDIKAVGSIPEDDSDEQANNDVVTPADDEEIAIPGGSGLSEGDLAINMSPSPAATGDTSLSTATVLANIDNTVNPSST
jgi:hypothetical protein